MERVTAVIVHYRGREAVRRCVASLDDLAEAVVVDNQGVGGELRHALPDPRVRVVEMRRNVGYGAAANVGLALAGQPVALVLNQDTVARPGAVRAMLDAAEASGAWLVGPRLTSADGIPAATKRSFPPPLRWRPPAEPSGPGWRLVPWIAGAAMLFPRGHTDLRFDERLHMYVEDEELCWRVWARGGRVALAEDAEVRHEGGTAAATRWPLVGVTRRTVLNRARMVRWHAGWRGVPAYASHVAARALRRAG